MFKTSFLRSHVEILKDFSKRSASCFQLEYVEQGIVNLGNGL